jgi:hypothetical protein
MIQHLKTVKATIIIGILLISFIPFLVTDNSTVSAAKLITFHSYMDLDYNTSALNKPLEIDVSISIPITVIYWTDIPPIFNSALLPFPINNLILFGSPVGPMQKIHLEILQQPEWANIYFSSSDVIMEIPVESEGKFKMDTNLIISPKVEAPAESQRISIKVTCEKFKRLGDYTFQEDISFTPSFIPTISIETDNPIRTVGPHTSVSFKLTVKNMGNKITRVTPDIIGDDKWTTTINPPNYEINPNSESTFVFSLITPYDFGWHNEYGRFEVNFFYEVYPYRAGSPTDNESIYLVINNNGFSLPGFEFSTVIIAFLAVFVILQKRRNRN